jgi:hypothetical protein
MRQDRMCRILAPVCCAIVCAAFAGCGGTNYDGDQRFAVSGKVTVDGEPMDHGLIAFMPQGQDVRVAGGPITNGVYSIPEEKGPNAGTYRVEIHWNVKTGQMGLNRDTGEPEFEIFKEGLPPKYHENSELTANVSKDDTTFDFDLDVKSE